MKRDVKELGKVVDKLNEKFEERKRQEEDLERQLQSLNSQVDRLIQSSKSDVYETNEGDALTDALIFEHDQRSDTDLYRELYGLDHRKVLELQSM